MKISNSVPHMGKFSSKSNFRSKIGSLPQFGHHIPMLYLMDDILPFFFRNCTSIKRHYKLWYTLSVAQRLTISFCGLQRLRPIAMSAKVSYGELRDKACDALNAASSVMKNAKTSSTQIAYNVSHNNTAACKPKKLYTTTQNTQYTTFIIKDLWLLIPLRKVKIGMKLKWQRKCSVDL